MRDPSPTEARRWLRQLAEQMLAWLERYRLSIFEQDPALSVRMALYTEGWLVDLGHLTLPSMDRVSVYLDRIINDGRYHAWAGFFVSGDERIRHVAHRLERHIGKPHFLQDRAFRQSKGFTVLCDPLTRSSRWCRAISDGSN